MAMQSTKAVAAFETPEIRLTSCGWSPVSSIEVPVQPQHALEATLIMVKLQSMQVHGSAARHGTARRSMAQHSTAQHSTAQHDPIEAVPVA